MDPTSANQYQNLHYTFQNLALSPPPPPPSEMPALPQNGANGPANGQEAVYYEEYAGNGQQPTHQGHQQQQQQQQQQGHQQYYEQQQQPGQGGQQQRAGPEGPADMRSVGRNGWGSTAGANANGGTAGAMSNASRGKGQRSGLPSQWLQDPSLMHQQGGQQHQQQQQPAHHHQHGPQHPQQYSGGQGGYANGPQGSYAQQGPNGYAYDRSTSPNPSQQLSTHSISPPPSAGSQVYGASAGGPPYPQQQQQQQGAPQQQHMYSASSPMHQSMPSPTLPGQKYGFAPAGGPQGSNGTGPNGPGPNGGNPTGLGNSGGPGGGGAGGWGGGPMVGAGLGSGVGAGPGPFSMGPGVGGGLEDDVIPTAIVIKNINFNLQKEDLLRTIESLGAPLPYAFNYHMDQGVFRGLAFANFRSAHEADAVVAALNGYDVGGRKLRVEYKKVLQAGEKERIEREKALRRMRSIQQPQQQQQQLPPPQAMMLGQNGAIVPPQLQQAGPQSIAQQMGNLALGSNMADSYPDIQPVALGLGLGSGGGGMGSRDGSTSSQGTNPAIPIVQVTSGGGGRVDRGDAGSDAGGVSAKSAELDLNDPTTLDIYSRVLVFKEDRMRDELAFSRTLSASQRRVVHLVAQKLGVFHYSVGEGDERYAVVTRSEARGGDRAHRHQASRPPPQQQQGNAGGPPSNLYAASPSLRNKSSMPDLSHLHGPAVSRDPTRAILSQRSTMNLREGYATVGTVGAAARRSQTNPAGLFQDQQLLQPPNGPYTGPKGNESTDSLLSADGGSQNGASGTLLRQPRGPPAVNVGQGFNGRRLIAPGSGARVNSPGGQVDGQQQHQQHHRAEDNFATSHEPLEF